MKDLAAKLEKYRLEAEDCELISKLAGDANKREFFAKLAVQFRRLSRDIEEQMAHRERYAEIMASSRATIAQADAVLNRR
jgi:hypothetical protein